MLKHFLFFIVMLVGLSIWNLVFPSHSQSILEIIGTSIVATLAYRFISWAESQKNKSDED